MKYGDFRVYRTTDRSEADGDYIIQLPPGLINPEERYVAVVHRTSGSGQRVPRSALARIVGSERLEAGTCRLDQTIRARIGVKAEHELDEKEKEYLVEVHRVLEPKRTGLFQEILAEAIRPRKLMLTLKRSAEVDAEKNIAITAPENVNLLGVGEGDHIMASTVVWDSDEKVFRTDQASFKVVGRTEYEVAEKSRVREELNMREILRVDVVGRQQLGVAGWEQDGASFYDIDFEQGHPVVIQADLARMFRSRVLNYGISLSVAFLALNSLFNLLLSSDLATFLITLFCTILATAVIIFIDLKARAGY